MPRYVLSDDSCRYACGQGVRWYVMRDDGACGNNSTIANGDSLQNGGALTNPNRIANMDWGRNLIIRPVDDMTVETSYDYIPSDGATLANLDYVSTGDLYILIDESPVDDKPSSRHNGDERTSQHFECVCDFHTTTFLYL